MKFETLEQKFEKRFQDIETDFDGFVEDVGEVVANQIKPIIQRLDKLESVQSFD